MSDGGTDSLPVGPKKPGRVSAPGRRPEIGMRLGRYQIVAPIASGGMAEVWAAKQVGELGFQRQVALKTIRAEFAADPSFKRSFLEEARVASRLHHAHVVEVLDLGEDQGIFFLAMPFIDGPSLRGLEDKRGPVPLPILWRIALDALGGLEAAHQLVDDQGVPMKLIHRDVSPQNILIGADGVAKLADFGVAKALGRLVDETEGGQLRGKLGYLSPEQVGRRPIDQRSDLFSMGVVIWELAVRRRLFKGDDLLDTFTKLIKGEVPDLRAINPAVPPGIAAVIGRALSADPNARPSSARELADALERAAESEATPIATHREVAAYVQGGGGVELASEEPTGLIEQTSLGPRAARWRTVVVGILLLAIVSLVVVARTMKVPVEPLPQPTVEEPQLAPAELIEPMPPVEPPAVAPPPVAAPIENKAKTPRRARPRPKFANPYSQ